MSLIVFGDWSNQSLRKNTNRRSNHLLIQYSFKQVILHPCLTMFGPLGQLHQCNIRPRIHRHYAHQELLRHQYPEELRVAAIKTCPYQIITHGTQQLRHCSTRQNFWSIYLKCYTDRLKSRYFNPWASATESWQIVCFCPRSTRGNTRRGIGHKNSATKKILFTLDTQRGSILYLPPYLPILYRRCP